MDGIATPPFKVFVFSVLGKVVTWLRPEGMLLLFGIVWWPAVALPDHSLPRKVKGATEMLLGRSQFASQSLTFAWSGWFSWRQRLLVSGSNAATCKTLGPAFPTGCSWPKETNRLWKHYKCLVVITRWRGRCLLRRWSRVASLGILVRYALVIF